MLPSSSVRLAAYLKQAAAKFSQAAA